MPWESVAASQPELSTNLIRLNCHEFICGAIWSTNSDQKLLKFNIYTNEWTEFLKLSRELSIRSINISLNSRDNIMYISIENKDEEHGIIILHIDTKQYKKIHLSEGGDTGPLLFIPNNDLHFIRNKGMKHCRLPQNGIEPQILCTYTDLIGYVNLKLHQCVYSSKTERIYTFEGFADNGIKGVGLDTIISYNLKTAKY